LAASTNYLPHNFASGDEERAILMLGCSVHSSLAFSFPLFETSKKNYTAIQVPVLAGSVGALADVNGKERFLVHKWTMGMSVLCEPERMD
jgi:hypothetical protein